LPGNLTGDTAAMGARVFAAGTVEWRDGLDNHWGTTSFIAEIEQRRPISGLTSAPDPPDDRHMQSRGHMS